MRLYHVPLLTPNRYTRSYYSKEMSCTSYPHFGLLPFDAQKEQNAPTAKALISYFHSAYLVNLFRKCKSKVLSYYIIEFKARTSRGHPPPISKNSIFTCAIPDLKPTHYMSAIHLFLPSLIKEGKATVCWRGGYYMIPSHAPKGEFPRTPLTPSQDPSP